MVESHHHAPLQSNIEYDSNDHFPLENIPLGVFVGQDGAKHVCTRIGKYVIDLAVLFFHGLFGGPHFASLNKNVFDSDSINQFMSLGKDFWHEARVTIQNLFTKGDTTL